MPARTEYDLSALFEPLEIRNISLKSRFVMPAMGRHWNEDGRPSQRLARYYRRRVEGGTGLIISEACAIDHPSATSGTGSGRATAYARDGWARCAEEVRAAGGHFFLQLWHFGGMRKEGVPGPFARYPTLSPSGFVTGKHLNGRPASLRELADIKDAFISAAVLAKEAGASGIEVHGAHGFLLDQFFWRETNRRTDVYGGPEIADRARFPVEVVAGIRDAVGEDFVIGYRFSQWKEWDYEATVVDSPAELEEMLRLLRTAGVDIFHASARRFWVPEWPGSDLGVAGWTKKLTDATVIGVGSVGLDIPVMESLHGDVAHGTGVESFLELERRFARGDFDLIAVGRSQISNPDWVRKVRDGDVGAIRVFSKAHLEEDEDALEAASSA